MHLKVLLNSFRELYSTGCKVSQSLTKAADDMGIKIDALWVDVYIITTSPLNLFQHFRSDI